MRAAPDPTATEVAHCGAGGAKPHNGRSGPLQLGRPQAPRPRQWAIENRLGPTLNPGPSAAASGSSQESLIQESSQASFRARRLLHLPLLDPTAGQRGTAILFQAGRPRSSSGTTGDGTTGDGNTGDLALLVADRDPEAFRRLLEAVQHGG